ncbi:MAG: DsbA family protein [Alphaproteobacteria bacterium]|nr:DsbA family protein [Alphaproteobacteria bacterium]
MKLRFAILSLFLVVAVAAALGLAFFTLPSPQDVARQTGFDQKVRTYLLSHPEVLVEATSALERRRTQRRVVERRRTLASFKRVIRGAGGLPVWGNPKGDVTVVEFFDYRCPYCKRSLNLLRQLVSTDRNLRVVFKEYPILGPESVLASRVAIASSAQGKYLEMHNALMSHRGQFDEKSVMALARELGLDTDRLRADMKNPKVKATIAETRLLADRLAISGTPAFVIGDELVPGYVDLVTLKKLVLQARIRCVTC